MFQYLNNNRAKVLTIFILGIAVLALTILASNLLNSDFSGGGGQAIVSGPGGGGIVTDGGSSGIPNPDLWFRNLLIGFGVLALIATFRFPRRAGATLVSIIAILFFYFFFVPDFQVDAPTTVLQLPDMAFDEIEEPTELLTDVVAPEVPGWFTGLFQLAIVSVGVAAAIYFYRSTRPEIKPEYDLALQGLASDAQNAIFNIEGGAELKDAILRCYAQMVNTLTKTRAVSYQQAMTPREFEQTLVDTGLPLIAVGRLTRLFETVRYSTNELGERDRLEAVSCLGTVVDAVSAENSLPTDG